VRENLHGAIARTLPRPARARPRRSRQRLDTETERAVQQAFDTLTRGRTTITIGHSLSTVRNADQIIGLDHGRIIEAGDHISLLAGQGRYAELAA
jgi:ATP-binding cassette, subfamily B, bacterial